MLYKKGISLISALVATIIIIMGISCVVGVLQQTERMYRRASNFQDFSLASDILFDEIQEQFGVIGTDVPDEIHGKMNGFQNLFYHVKFEKIKDGLYEVHIKITKTIEGKPYSEEFVSALSQR
ncbi:MAG TPA: hypothetical protein P5065_01335 [Candidatus Ratteibacteria bacterium]|jgi:hypothetical protein|uniref:Uncharacterized protein n=1 Tax=candidate division TA06 bacterium ADurb.Bin131 TaxID=1852827 RepID=A0A1V6C972_UNCT6|nr:MAG: hypothetical protein BWX89_00957 [candidate division TA06 bacterium ADurb.Bin131]HOC02425.1 hypothetical protein [bacterium]HRS05672.1 hypothetical protein [Candidatus Ratteibacteria bacterium]HON04926.1 hypothetical protein [bacterium]HOQ81937.1 hypothetical protein [bacterium]